MSLLIPVALIAASAGFLVGMWWNQRISGSSIRARDEVIAQLRQQRDNALANTDRLLAEWGKSNERMRRTEQAFDEAFYRMRAKSKDLPS